MGRGTTGDGAMKQYGSFESRVMFSHRMHRLISVIRILFLDEKQILDRTCSSKTNFIKPYTLTFPTTRAYSNLKRQEFPCLNHYSTMPSLKEESTVPEEIMITKNHNEWHETNQEDLAVVSDETINSSENGSDDIAQGSTPEEDCSQEGKQPTSPRAPRKRWKKPKGKPNRPLSAYNLFFQAERLKILAEQKDLPENEKVAFRNMGSLIGARWKKLPEESKAVLQQQADKEKKLYFFELEAWKARQAAKKKAISGTKRVEAPPPETTELALATKKRRVSLESESMPLSAQFSGLMARKRLLSSYRPSPFQHDQSLLLRDPLLGSPYSPHSLLDADLLGPFPGDPYYGFLEPTVTLPRPHNLLWSSDLLDLRLARALRDEEYRLSRYCH